MKKPIIMLLLLTLLIFFAIPVNAADSKKTSVTLRIEGISGNLFYKTEEISQTGALTAKDVILFFDKKYSSITVALSESGYITEINGEAAGDAGGWSGWSYAVNGKIADVGIDGCIINQDDEIVLYYADYPCQIPVIDTSKLNSNGIIKITSFDTTFDDNWNATVTENTVSGAQFLWYVESTPYKFTTDENGEVRIGEQLLTAGDHVIQVSRNKDNDGISCPDLLRLAPGYAVNVKAKSVNTGNSPAPQATDRMDYVTQPATGDRDMIPVTVLFILSAAVIAIASGRRYEKS